MITDVDYTVFIPIHTSGKNVLFKTISPTEKELQYLPRLNLTGKNELNSTSVSLRSNVSINRIEPEPGFKEQILTLLPRKIAQTTQFDNTLEDIPTRQTYSSTGNHTNISAEVLADRFGILIERANATLKQIYREAPDQPYSLLAGDTYRIGSMV